VIRDEVIIREINALWLPVYPYMADHLLAASGVGGGRFLDLGPFAGGLALNILRKCETFVATVRGAFFFLTPTLLTAGLLDGNSMPETRRGFTLLVLEIPRRFGCPTAARVECNRLTVQSGTGLCFPGLV